MAKNEVKITITGDASKLKGAVNSADASLGGFAQKSSSKGAAIAGAVAGAFAVDRILSFGGEMFSLGQKLDVFDRKASTVFEGSAGDVRAWADRNNESFGISNEELTGLAANFGDLLKPMGLTAEQAATMSKDVVGLSGALSAWSGGTRSAAEVSEILAKAMLGERDGLKELGISILDSDVQARLAAKGQEKLTGAALEQAKAVATQELIFEKSKDAQKAWADGSLDGIKNTNKIKAGFEDLKAAVGGFVAGAAADVLDWVQSTSKWFSDHEEILAGVATAIAVLVIPAFWGWATAAGAAAAATIAAAAPFIAIAAVIGAVTAALVWAYQNWGWFRSAVDAVVSFFTDTVWPAIQSVAGWLKDVLGGAVTWIGNHWRAVWNPIAGFMTSVFERIKGVINGAMQAVRGIIDVVMGIITGNWGRVWNGIKDVFSGVWNAIKSAASGGVEAVWGVIRSIPGKIASVAGLVLNAAKSVGKAIWNGIVDGITGVASFVGDIAKKIWRGIADFINSKFILPIARFKIDIPLIGDFQPFKIFHGLKLHTGGVVPGGFGQEVPALLMAGETVRTRAQEARVQSKLNGSAGATIMVTVNVGGGVVDGAKVGREIAGYLDQYARTSGSTWRA